MSIPVTELSEAIPVKVRKVLYVLYGLFGLGTAGAVAAYGALEQEQPPALVVALAVSATLAPFFATLAVGNAHKQEVAVVPVAAEPVLESEPNVDFEELDDLEGDPDVVGPYDEDVAAPYDR